LGLDFFNVTALFDTRLKMSLMIYYLRLSF
jgi:hypothetical protein